MPILYYIYFLLIFEHIFFKLHPCMDFDEIKEEFKDVIDLKAAFTGSLPGDNSILSELGIDFDTIRSESKLVFNIFKSSELDTQFIKNADITGPLVYIIFYSICLLCNYKIHFGYIYSLTLFSIMSSYFLLNVMDLVNIKLLECCSVLGYSFLPLTLFSFFNIFISKINVLYRIIFGIFIALWSAYTASLIFVKYLNVENKQILIGYPLFITYVCFAMIVIF